MTVWSAREPGEAGRLEVPVTGDAAVDAVLRRLVDGVDAPLDVQAEVYADVAASLQRVLDEPQP